MNFIMFKDIPRVTRVLFDILLLVALVVLAEKTPNLGRHITQRGFFCDDTSLHYPYHNSTVTKAMLYAGGICLPLLVIIAVELLVNCVKSRQQRCSKNSSVATSNCSMAKSWQFSYHIIFTFLLGYACERVFKSLAKSTVGRLRPHFLAVCRPILADGRNCTDPNLAGVYIEDYSCQGGENITDSMMRNAHLSFPSGHSSLSFYGLVFLALYLQYRWSVHSFGARLLKPVLQLSCLLLAWFVTLSRIMDNKHHWSDSLAGSLLGSIVAVFIYYSSVRRWEVKNLQKPVKTCDCAKKKTVTNNEVLCEIKCVPLDMTN